VPHTPGFFAGYRLLESRIRFIALSVGMVTGLSSEGLGAERCPGSAPWPVPLVLATSPNPAWRPKPPSHWPPIPPARPQTIPRAAPEPRRILAVVPLIRDQRYYGEYPASVPRVSGECPASLPCISPPSIVGLAVVTVAPGPAPARQIVGWAALWPRESSSVIGVAVGAG
jgi:hypothetical protein